MNFLRGLFDRKAATAWKAFTEGRLDEAVELHLALTRERPEAPGTWWNLGLVYKEQRRWDESLAAFRRHADLSPTPEAFWNTALAATALRDWPTARWAWRRLDFDVGSGDGPPEADFGPNPVRLNPATNGEVVWGVRIDPCRVRIASVPLPESGHRWGDVVLHEVAPRGSRTTRAGEEFPVFDEIERMEASPHPTYRAELSWAAPDDALELESLLFDRKLGGENWTAGVAMLCEQCSLDGKHRHDHDRPGQVALNGTWGFGGPRADLDVAIRDWAGAGEQRVASALEEAR